MNKSVIIIIAALVAVLGVSYFWNNKPAVVIETNPTADALAPEDAALSQEIQDLTPKDVDAEFKDVDASLNSL